jgi:hypothetical protein
MKEPRGYLEPNYSQKEKGGVSRLIIGGSHFFHGTTKVGLTRV